MRCAEIFLNDSYQMQGMACLTSLGEDAHGPYFLLDQTIFYPQGGGQPSDMGLVGGMPVSQVRREGEEIRHYFSGPPGPVGVEQEMAVDAGARLQHMALHSGAHLIAQLAGVEAVKGHHYPDGPYVEFAGPKPADTAAFLTDLNARLQEAIREAWPVTVSKRGDRLRYVGMGDGPAVGCGGTHVRHLGELAWVRTTKIKAKSGNWRIAYEARHLAAYPLVF